jgi:hypothetical protein
VKKLLWFLVTSILLLGSFSMPTQLKADGNPMCPPSKPGCKASVGTGFVEMK